MSEKQTKVTKIVTVAVVVAMFVLLLTLVFQFVKINNLKQNQKILSNKLTELEQSILYYSSENDYLQSGDFIEDYAREVLGYGKAGETRFR